MATVDLRPRHTRQSPVSVASQTHRMTGVAAMEQLASTVALLSSAISMHSAAGPKQATYEWSSRSQATESGWHISISSYSLSPILSLHRDTSTQHTSSVVFEPLRGSEARQDALYTSHSPDSRIDHLHWSSCSKRRRSCSMQDSR